MPNNFRLLHITNILPYNTRSPLNSDGLTDPNNDSPQHFTQGYQTQIKIHIHINTRTPISNNRLLGTTNDSPQYNSRLSYTSKGMSYTFNNGGTLQPSRRNNNNQNMPKRRTVENKIKVLYTNVYQFSNKIHELLINIGIFKPDVIMITEVLPNNSETKTTKVS